LKNEHLNYSYVDNSTLSGHGCNHISATSKILVILTYHIQAIDLTINIISP